MLKFAALALGVLTVVTTIAPIARSTEFQLEREARHQGGRTRSNANSQLRAEKLVPIKKSAKLAPTVIKATSRKVPIDRKVELSAENKEIQRIQTACQPEFANRGQFKSNERAVGMFENSPTANGNNPNGSNLNAQNNIFNSPYSSNSSANQGSCGFSIRIPYQ